MAEYSRFSLSFDPSNLSPLSNSLSGRRLISYKHCYSSLCHKVAPLRNVVMLQRNSTSIKPWKLCRNPDLERLVSVLCRSIGFFNSHSKLQSREAISEGSTIQQYKISSVSRLEIRACVSTLLPSTVSSPLELLVSLSSENLNQIILFFPDKIPSL